jgi:amino acid transporter
MALTGSFVWLAVMSTLVRMITYIVCIAALTRLQKVIEPIDGQFTLPGGPAIPAIALILCLWLISYVSLEAWLTTFAFMGFGTLLYAWSKRYQ